ncbi:unnamed protein product, partial [marine sediment metagenome]
METEHNYSLIEKLAIVKTLDEIILADEKIDPGEEELLKKIMHRLEFNKDFVPEARKMRNDNSLNILSGMSPVKKKDFAKMMHEIAIVDGTVDDVEVNLIISIYREVGIDIEQPDTMDITFDLAYVYFESSNYNIYNEGPGGSRRNTLRQCVIKIEPVLNKLDAFLVSVITLDETRSIWGSEAILKPLQMKIVSNKNEKIT